jgi:hypothetical protein
MEPVAARSAPPVGHGDYLSTDKITDPLRLFLSARPEGLRESLMLRLVTPEDGKAPSVRKLRNALVRIGAVQVSEEGRWRL